MDITKQNQKSGDNSTQIQIMNSNIYTLLSPEAVNQVIGSFTEFARAEVQARIVDFSDNYLIPRIKKIENGLEAYKDPAYQMLLIEASKKAASTTRTLDYSMLSELMARRFEKRNNIKANAVISKAVEVIDLIDDDSLAALSLIFFIICDIKPVSGSICEGLQVLDNIAEKILSSAHINAEDNKWVDNLETLQALKTYMKGTIHLHPFSQIYTERLDGYTVSGVEKNSEKHLEFETKLKSVGLPINILVEHELNNGFIRLNVAYKEQIQNEGNFSEEQRRVLNEIFTESRNASNTPDMQTVLSSYITAHYKYLSAVRDFWEKLPPLTLMALGRLIGYMNLKRLVPELPEIDIERI